MSVLITDSFYRPKTVRIQEVLDRVQANHADADLSLIQRAYVFAASVHSGQTRLSGEPYLSHPLAVAYTLAEMGFDEPTIAAGLLHDTVEDTIANIEDVDDQFGEEVADIVDGVTKISQMSFSNKEEAQAENIRKMILAMSHDMRVLMVKLADRLHNMETLEFQKAHKQQRIAQETIDIYAPLANRLGLHSIKSELEDLCFKYLKPDIFNQVEHWLNTHQVVEKQIIEKVVNMLKILLSENDLQGNVYGRIKHKYSIYKKMQSQSLTLDEMHDIMAFRVLVNSIRDCYAVLGLVHSKWKPIHGRFKDYISMPKANGYQSLHTTVVGPEGERIEIQIRTVEMHRQAEHGVAAHWLYKEKGRRVNSRDLKQFSWLREIFERQREESDAKEFMHALKLDLFEDEVYVHTPAGDVKELPKGATPLDFAFLIHTNVGHHCAGAKINGRLMPLSTVLKNGDTVEIITDPHRTPNRDWLQFVKTARARSRIQHWLRTEERAQAMNLGKEMLDKEGRKISLNVSKAMRSGQLAIVASEFNYDRIDDLLAAIGYAHLTPRRVLNRLFAILHPEKYNTLPLEETEKTESTATTNNTNSVGISGFEGVLTRFATCCQPVLGDAIVGYISRGKGLTIHRADCHHISGMEPDRLIDVHWLGKEDVAYSSNIFIIAKDRCGILAAISTELANRHINIQNLSFKVLVDGRAEMRFTVQVHNTTELYGAIEHIRKLPDILEVIRDRETEV